MPVTGLAIADAAKWLRYRSARYCWLARPRTPGCDLGGGHEMAKIKIRGAQSRAQNATRKENEARILATTRKDGKGKARVTASRARAKKKSA